VDRAGIRKAALLLMGLEPATAAELLRAADPEAVTEIAAELAYLDAVGEGARESAQEPVREFVEQLRSRGSGRLQKLKATLEQVLGVEAWARIDEQIPRLVEARDPFIRVREAEPEQIAVALREESAQVAALVLAELPPKVSGQVLPLLNEEVQGEIVQGMARAEPVRPATRAHVASVVERKLAAAAEGPTATGQAEQLRKVALVLRDMGTELRNALIQAIEQSDAEASLEVQRLMVLWEDVPLVSDRSLQGALRGVEASKLAMALWEAEEAVVDKIRGNLSERQAAMLDEEATLLSTPRDEDIEAARDELLGALRDLAGAGELTFEEG